MKKIYLATISILVLASAIVFWACNKETEKLNTAKVTPKAKAGDESIPIAQLNKKGEMELLFSQSEIQEYFMAETGVQLIFADVIDDAPLKENSNCYFLINSYDEKTDLREAIAYTSIEKIFDEKGMVYTYTNLF